MAGSATTNRAEWTVLTIFGHGDGISGTSRHALAFFRALSQRNQTNWVSLDEILPEAGLRSVGGQQGARREDPSVAIGIGAPDVMPRIRGRRRVAFVVWETTQMPESRLRFLRDVDEIWTPTAWGREVLTDSGLEATRIQVVPEGVAPEIFRPIPREGTQKGPFRFLAVGKWERRKGHDLLLRAWSRAFSQSEDVELVMHTYHPQDPGWTLDDAVADLELGSHAPIRWSRPTDPLRLVLLYNACDRFVLATRGEGWCLPVFEALACGKPVTVPRFGALAELLDKQVADFVSVDRLSPAGGGGAYPASDDCGLWAEPDVDHLIELLRKAREHPGRGRAMGQVGREKVVGQWCWGRAADVALSHLGHQE